MPREDFPHARRGADSTRNMMHLAPTFMELVRIGAFLQVSSIYSKVSFRYSGPAVSEEEKIIPWLLPIML
jgi:hypothetical protein